MRRKRGNGFTFFELLVVMGIFVLVGGFALLVSFETYRGSNFRSDRDLLIATLQRARAEAVNNVCLGSCTDGKPHGVKILSDGSVVVFQGTAPYVPNPATDAKFKMSVATTTPGSATEFVFTQLSATSTAATTTLRDNSGHYSTTTVNAEGQISWTN